MTSVRRIRLKQLHEAFDRLPVGMDIQSKSALLGAAVVRALLSEEWFDRYVDPGKKKSIFTIDQSDPIKREISYIKMIDLAEVIYNLQDVPGYDGCLSCLREGTVEGTFAEFDFGRMLFLNKAPFRFVTPTGVKKESYDIEILYPNGVVACADAKCKIESAEFSENTIRNALNEARDQLPNDAPGVVLIKVPARWIANPVINVAMIQRARRFLGGAPRIVSVKFYTAPMSFHDNMMRVDHAYKEISNPRTLFGNDIDWNVFKPHILPDGGSGMPSHWQRILFFPTGIRK